MEFSIEALKTKNDLDMDFKLIKKYMKQLKDKIGGNREIMYSDIINLIAKEGYKGESVTKLIRWCGNQIKKGNYFIDFYLK